MTVCGIKHADGVCVMGECPYFKKCCPAVWDKSGEPMTNEEYLKSCNTEQLAKVLLSFCQYPCEICKIECDGGNACTYNKALNTIVEWLKEKHNDNMG